VPSVEPLMQALSQHPGAGRIQVHQERRGPDFVRSCADSITLNCIAPGHVGGSGMSLVTARPLPGPEQERHRVDTENQMLEPRRMVAPEEVAGALLYLVGPYAGRVTGTVMHVNGGSYLPA
jgi:NAD(P)-dependent dehydrogenase (short-subunit alcohol dehydrogenase family)